MEITGTIFLIEDTKEVGANNFKKRLMVIETAGQYPTKIPIDFLGDKTDILDKYAEGESVTVGLNLKGNEHQGRWFSQIIGWKIEKMSNSPAQSSPTSNNQSFEPASDYNEQEPDNLPF